MKIFLCILLSVLPFLSFASDVYVQGYTRKDGTHVEGHYRSAPNSTTADNFSTYGNINPYTGELGTKRFNESNDSSSSSYNNDQENRQSVEHSMFTGTCNTNDAESFSIEFNNDVLIAKGKYKARRSESDSNAWAFYSNKGYSYYLGNLNSGKIPIKVSNKWGLNTRGLCTVN
jgi:hypothetical protein